MPKTIIKMLLVTLLSNSIYAASNCNIISQGDFHFNCTLVNMPNCMSIASITLHCTSNPQYSLSLNQGNSRNFIQRTLVNRSNPNYTIGYNVYTSPNRQSILGDGTQGSAIITGNCNNCTINMYAFITASLPNTIQEGVYSDSLLLTINYQ